MESDRLEQLFDELRSAEGQAALTLEQDIYTEFSRSGSDAMDFLLERGREAMGQGNTKLAIEHLTALIDHAPEFAEGYNARATAYYSAGYYGLSMADIAVTLSLEPRHFGALSGLALILEELDRPAQSLEVVREIEKIHPNMQGLSERIERLELATQGTAL